MYNFIVLKEIDNMPTRNIVPRANGEGNIGTTNKKWNEINSVTVNGSTLNAETVNVTAIEAQKINVNGQDIENLAGVGLTVLTRSTPYTIGMVVYSTALPNWACLECIQAGTTGESEPENLNTSIEIGEEIVDGNITWITRHVKDGHVKGEVYPMSGATFTEQGFLIHPLLNITMNDVHICDGTNGTPDLRGRFVIASDNQVNGTYKENATGGEYTHKLNTNEIPSHGHSASTNTTGGHTHTFSGNTSIPTGESMHNAATSGTESGGTFNTSSAGSHSHSVTINSTGGNQAHNNMPPYYALVFVKKIK